LDLAVGGVLLALVDDAGVGEGGPDGEVEVEAVAGGVDGLRGDGGVVGGGDVPGRSSGITGREAGPGRLSATETSVKDIFPLMYSSVRPGTDSDRATETPG
jgi:hypothetical protein